MGHPDLVAADRQEEPLVDERSFERVREDVALYLIGLGVDGRGDEERQVMSC